MLKQLATLALAGVAAAALARPADVTETRTVGAFTQIRLEGVGDVSVKVGGATAVAVTAPDSLAPLVTTEVKNGVLVIGMKKNDEKTRGKIKIAVATPTLTGVALSGAGSIHAEGIAGERFAADLSGSGKLEAGGSVRQVKAVLSGAGSSSLEKLAAREADVVLSGAGNVSVNAAEALNVRLTGAGDVRYAGNPARRDVKVTGAGKIKAQ